MAWPPSTPPASASKEEYSAPSGGREVAQDPVQRLGDDHEIVAAPAVLPGVEVGAGEEGLVRQHLLEVRHEPPGVGRVAAEAADDVVVDAPGRHGVEGALRHLACGLASSAARERGVHGGTARRAWDGETSGRDRSRPTRGRSRRRSPSTTAAMRSAASRSAPAGLATEERATRRIRTPASAAGRASARTSARSSSRSTAATSASACARTCSALGEPRLAQRLHDAAERAACRGGRPVGSRCRRRTAARRACRRPTWASRPNRSAPGWPPCRRCRGRVAPRGRPSPR